MRRPGLMAGSWLQNVATGNMEAAAGMTEGGSAECEKLVKKLERRVGKLNQPSGQEVFAGAQEDKARGTATVTLPVSGDDGSATAIFHMKAQQMGIMKMWLVEDITFEDSDSDRDPDRDTEEDEGGGGSRVRGSNR